MAETLEPKTLYIFIDESGNFDFSPKGTKYFALTSVSTLQPLADREAFPALRYDLLRNGVDEEFFHATEDLQDTRNAVFGIIKKLGDIEVDCVVAQKNKANPSLYIKYELKNGKIRTLHSEEKFYDKLTQILLQYIFNRHQDRKDIEKIVIVLGSLFTNTKRGYVLKSLKQYLKAKFGKPFQIYFHDTRCDINCQIADYCGWAIYVAAERGEERPFKEIEGKVKSCFDVFKTGTNIYYEYQ
jgi:hypothetical protein